MKVIRPLDIEPPFDNAAVTSGNFDGVHLGHLKILDNLVKIAKRYSIPSVLLTFWPHPKLIIDNNSRIELLNTLSEKIELLSKTDLDYLAIVPFDKRIAALSPNEYVETILIDKLHTAHFVIGYDHRFGKDRAGDFHFLKSREESFDITVDEIPKRKIEQTTISSSKIREHLKSGEVKKAREYLGRNYELSGKVIHGDKIGRELGFKTANLDCSEEHKLIPGNGVYAVKISGSFGTKNGMLNIGMRPTVNGIEKRIEANIFDLNTNLYGTTLKIEFIQYMRPEVRFENQNQLKQQLKKDKENVLNLINNERI